MQIVLSGNRVIAYGENCFLAMGGTVVCEETGKAYPNATIAEVETLPADIGRVGYEYHAGIFIPCAPYGMDNGNGTILVACEECGTPKDSGLRIDEIIGARLNVTAPAGCEVACTNGDKAVKGIYKNGEYVCNLTDYGEWTVTAGRWHGLAYDYETGTVEVDIVKQYTLALGATISVEYPEGSTVTCTHGDVVLTAPDTSGAWTFDVLAFGEWELYCTNGTDETSRKFTVSMGGQVETIVLAYFAADIEVTYPANSTCTCTDGVTTFTDTNDTGATKTATFTVPNLGTWTVTATDGTDIKTRSVSITEAGQRESVVLTYEFILYENGVFGTTEDGSETFNADKKSQSGDATIKKNSTNMLWKETGNSWDVFYITPAICPAGYSTLNIAFSSDTAVDIDNNTGKWGFTTDVSNVDDDNPKFSGYKAFSDFNGAKTISYDVSEYTGTTEYFAALRFGTSDTTFSGYVTKIWLE